MARARFNVTRLVNDLGGPAVFAELVGKHRTAPYRWMRHNLISQEILEVVKSRYPQLDLDWYFDREESEHDPKAEGGT